MGGGDLGKCNTWSRLTRKLALATLENESPFCHRTIAIRSTCVSDLSHAGVELGQCAGGPFDVAVPAAFGFGSTRVPIQPREPDSDGFLALKKRPIKQGK